MTGSGERRNLTIGEPFSLAATCGPVAWGRGRWPNIDWVDGGLVWVGWDVDRVVDRRVRDLTGGRLEVQGSAAPAGDAAWAVAVLGAGAVCPSFDEPVVARLQEALVGLRAFAAGSLYEGLISSIVGQSISVAAAAVTEARLAALFAEGMAIGGRTYWPLPRAEQLADADPALVRRSGVTWRRAEALVAAGRAASEGRLPQGGAAVLDPVETRRALRALPLVGPWTAESALLWGLGAPDAHPTGDVALLRAARRAYSRPELTLRELDSLAERWRPARGWAARLLWTELLGPAPMTDAASESSRVG